MADVADGWEWDESLYAGAAAYYATGRFAYPADWTLEETDDDLEEERELIDLEEDNADGLMTENTTDEVDDA